MTPQGQWLIQNATHHCNRLHIRMTPRNCVAYQNVHDPSENSQWRNGGYAWPHECKGCEHFIPKAQRDPGPGAKQRKAPRNPDAMDMTKEKHIDTNVTVICPVCHEKRQVKKSSTYQPYFRANGGICPTCAGKKRRKPEIDKKKLVAVTCPVCKEKRTVQLGFTLRKKLFKDGTCKSCAAKITNQKRADPDRIPKKTVVDVQCPKCGQVRQVHYGTTREKGFKGTCRSCGAKEKQCKSIAQ